MVTGRLTPRSVFDDDDDDDDDDGGGGWCAGLVAAIIPIHNTQLFDGLLDRRVVGRRLRRS